MCQALDTARGISCGCHDHPHMLATVSTSFSGEKAESQEGEAVAGRAGI